MTHRSIAIGTWIAALGLACVYFLAGDIMNDRVRSLKLPETVELGVVTSTVAFEIAFENLEAMAIHIVGASTSCGCIAPLNLPLVVPPKSKAMLRLKYEPKADSTEAPTDLSLRMQLYATGRTAPDPIMINVVRGVTEVASGPLLPIPMD